MKIGEPSTPQRAAVTALFALFLSGCTSTEKAVVPLGFGPLAKAEEAEQQRLASERQQVDNNKPLRGTADFDFPVRSNGMPSASVEKSTKVSVAETPASSAPASPGQTPPVPTKVADWLGIWHGKDTTRYLIPSFPPQPMDDPHAKIRVESTRSLQIKLVLIDSSNESDLCALTAQLESNQAKVDPGQPCFGNDDDSSNLSVKVKSGVGTLRDSTLVLDLTLEADVQSEQFQANGTVEYHFEGKRI